MKKHIISLGLILALSSSGFSASIDTTGITNSSELLTAISQVQETLTLDSSTGLTTNTSIEAFFGKYPDQSIVIKRYAIAPSGSGASVVFEYAHSDYDTLLKRTTAFSPNMNLSTPLRVTEVIQTVTAAKTNTNADIMMLKKLLLDANVPSRYRTSELDGKLHYSLIANIDGTQFNVDLANGIALDSPLENKGYRFVFDDLDLIAATSATGTHTAVNEKSTFQYYSQTDKRWKLMKFSYSNIARTGCGPISATMIFDYLTPKEVKVTPQSVIQLARSQNLDIEATPRVHMPKLLASLSQKYGVSYKVIKTFDDRYMADSKLSAKVASPAVKNQVADEIKSGKVVLIATILNPSIQYTNGVEHFLVVKDYVNGMAIVFDPMPSHTFYEPVPDNLKKQYSGYFYQVPIDLLTKNMTQAYSFEQ